MAQRPAVLVAMKHLSAESCRYGNLFSRILYPLFWVCLFSTLNLGVEQSAHPQPQSVQSRSCSAEISLCEYEPGLSVCKFSHSWAQMQMIKTPDLILGREGSSQRWRVSFSLSNANELRINILHYGCVSLVAKIKYALTWETAWQQGWTAGEERKAFVVEMTSGLESSEKTSVKNCQRLFWFLLACCAKQPKKT